MLLRACAVCGKRCPGPRCNLHLLPARGRPHRRASEHVLTATHCAVCGAPFTEDNPLTRGHIRALKDGGTNDPSNYRPECRRCNYGWHGDAA